ncbi:hypothetical protein AY555_05380 [Haematospirillum jordaniae]|uniref:GGDEF domain-containing protein n=2 Tax=Haematospirillum jordaniae TaxID=1549855 RepID=A0A143DD94_9PROT|nr:hypothetical protein AY555_05380 [Haematospirillum jordaniae]
MLSSTSEQVIRQVQGMRVALLPVVSLHSARCIGYEAVLVDGSDDTHSMQGLQPLFVQAAAAGVLSDVTAEVFRLALHAFVQCPRWEEHLLFVSMDVRVLGYSDRLARQLGVLMEAYGVDRGRVVLALEAHGPVRVCDEAMEGLNALRAVAGRVAISHFGTGSSGLLLLFLANPDYIQLDRFFITGGLSSSRRRIFLGHMVNLSHLLGVRVMAQGVETEQEYLACREAGLDLVQGPLFGGESDPCCRPDMEQVLSRARDINARDRRRAETDQDLVQARITRIPPIPEDAQLADVLERFRLDSTHTFFPVVSCDGEPLGLVREQTLKNYVYAPYGKELLSNKGYARQLRDFLWPCPVADIRTSAEKILEIFSADEDSEGIIITADGCYAGFLSARSLLRLLNEKNLAVARDQNPLTRLPGNTMINAYMARVMEDSQSSWCIVYFDFDGFKPFNDTYGFRQGDRAIVLFANLLVRDLRRDDVFIGHIGGDDFVAGFRNISPEMVLERVRDLTACFRRDVESFYDPDARRNGYIVASDRNGTRQYFPLLSASAAVVHIPQGAGGRCCDHLAETMARLKSEAKAAPDRIVVACLGEPVRRASAPPATMPEPVFPE